jgi:hypothetical protein
MCAKFSMDARVLTSIFYLSLSFFIGRLLFIVACKRLIAAMETRFLRSDMARVTAFPTMICHQGPYPALEAVQHSAAGKYILITNASHGTGRAIALSWTKAKAAGIVICSPNAKDLESIVLEIRLINANIPLVALPCDTTRSSDVIRLFSVSKEVFGRLDVVVANVGTKHLENLDAKDDNDVWWIDATTNFRSTHLTAHEYIRTFGPAPTGTFISIPSGADFVVGCGISSREFAHLIDYRLCEFLTLEYPAMRCFSLDGGATQAGRARRKDDYFEGCKTDLVGLFSVWLGGGRADPMRGSCLRAEWDIRELELDMLQVLERNDLKQTLSSSCLRRAMNAM